MNSGLVALATVVCLTAGCALPGAPPVPPVSSRSPAGAASAPRLATPPPGVLACKAADLDAIFRGWLGATGTLAGSVVVVDRRPAPCVLDGYPQVKLLAANGDEFFVQDARGDFPPYGGAVVLRQSPFPSPGAALNSGDVYTYLVWSNWCGPRVAAVRLVVALPNGAGSIIVANPPDPSGGTPTPRCDAPGAQSSLQVSSFHLAA